MPLGAISRYSLQMKFTELHLKWKYSEVLFLSAKKADKKDFHCYRG